MSDFLLVRDGKVIGEIPNECVTVEMTEDGPRYIVGACTHDESTTCILCADPLAEAEDPR